VGFQDFKLGPWVEIAVDGANIPIVHYVDHGYLSKILIFEVIFVVFRLMKNITFKKTESFVGRNTSNHATFFYGQVLIINVNQISNERPPFYKDHILSAE
jgi:hypothetical protein